VTISDLKNKLSDLAFKVTQMKETEPPFSGKYNDLYAEGKYICVCCSLPLFSSKNKFNSKSGWPSFYQPINEDCLKYIEDNSHNMLRVEVCCKKCNSHLGHVFDDGPKPTFKRYCINSVSMRFVEDE
jgi:peptide-methionine (R)-S-oxide reductase|tara:strand:+ start:3410 stop:3790 length:381 start_codon:yes stop_codon:yes gene_type:complete